MHLTDTKIIYRALCLVSILLSACGGGGGGAAPGTTTVRSAYVANSGDNTISQYTIDATTGALTQKAAATVASISGLTNSTPSSVTVDPSGKYAYVANSGSEFISQFSIGAGGGLVPMNPPTVQSGNAGSGPISVTVDPMGRYVYAANSNENTVSLFTIASGGSLLFVTTFPSITGATWPGPVSVTVDPTGKYVYVVNQSSNFISQYTIGVGGALAAMVPPTVTTGTNPVSITIDPTGKYAYVANYGSDTISQYNIGSVTPGALTPMAPATVGGVSTQLSFPTSIAIDPSGTYAYVANGSGVYLYSITNGALTDNMNPKTILTGGTTPRSITVDSSGKFVYVANQGDSTISQFTIGAGGTLSTPTITSGAVNSQPYSITTAVSIQ